MNQWIANAAARLDFEQPSHTSKLARHGDEPATSDATARQRMGSIRSVRQSAHVPRFDVERRSDYDGSKYEFPVTQRRKRKAEAAEKENQPPMKQPRPVNVVQPAWMRV